MNLQFDKIFVDYEDVDKETEVDPKKLYLAKNDAGEKKLLVKVIDLFKKEDIDKIQRLPILKLLGYLKKGG